jgi:hypothetical protein
MAPSAKFIQELTGCLVLQARCAVAHCVHDLLSDDTGSELPPIVHGSLL